jgi:NitT/TauT family transport system substrate-binding protein
MEKLSLEEVNTFLDWDGMNYSTALYGWEGLIDFMYKQGYISKKPSLEDLCWYPVLAHIGKRSGEPSVLEKALKKQQ